MNEIVNLLPLIAAPIAAIIANGYVAAIIISALFYIVGEIGVDMSALNAGGRSQGETSDHERQRRSHAGVPPASPSAR